MNEVYHKSYIAMIDSNDDEYEAQCATFLAALDSDPPTETPMTEVFLAIEECSQSWKELDVNNVNAELLHLPEEDIYEPTRIWERPAGHAVRGVDAFKLRCHINTLKEPAVVVIGDSGAAPTLISQKFLENLQASKPKRRGGAKLKLIQLTGSAKCSEFVKLDLYFRSQLGPVCFKGVEAYVVKDMEANLIVSEDTQLAWQLHTIREEGKRHWKVGNSPHCIPAVPRLTPTETFTASWTTELSDSWPPPKQRKTPVEGKRTLWNASTLRQLTILPEAIATMTAVARGVPVKKTLYFEGISLKRGSDTFVQVPNCLVEPDVQGQFQVKIVNTINRKIIVRAGELLGHLHKAEEVLKMTTDITERELEAFRIKAASFTTLIPKLNTPYGATATTPEPADEEHLGWGPKTADPGPDRIYPSAKLRKVIDVDPLLETTQRKALYRVVERNQAAFGLDGRLGHLKSEVHIELTPGTKPISMAPYYASPAKREAIDKQIDLWLSQGVIEESKSPWGAPVIIVYRNDKPHRIHIKKDP